MQVDTVFEHSVDGIFEVFNLFTRANHGGYTTDEASP